MLRKSLVRRALLKRRAQLETVYRSHVAAMMSPVEALTAMHIDDFSYDHATP